MVIESCHVCYFIFLKLPPNGYLPSSRSIVVPLRFGTGSELLKRIPANKPIQPPKVPKKINTPQVRIIAGLVVRLSYIQYARIQGNT